MVPVCGNIPLDGMLIEIWSDTVNTDRTNRIDDYTIWVYRGFVGKLCCVCAGTLN